MSPSSSRALRRRAMLGTAACALLLAAAAPACDDLVRDFRDIVEKTTTDLKFVAQDLQLAIARATADVRGVVADALSSLRALVDSLDALLRDTVHTITEALSNALRDVLAQAQTLVAQLKTGILQIIQEVARELQRTIEQSFVRIQTILDETLRHAERVGGKLIARAANEVQTVVGQGAGIGLSLVGAIGLIQQLRPPPAGSSKKRSGVAIAVVTLLIVVGVGGVFGSRRILTSLGTAVELPDGHALCKQAAEKGRELRAAVAAPAKVMRVIHTGIPQEVRWYVPPRDLLTCDPAKKAAPVPGRNFFPPVFGPEEGTAGAQVILPVRPPGGATGVETLPARAPLAVPIVRDELPAVPVQWGAPRLRDMISSALTGRAPLPDPFQIRFANAIRAHKARFDAGATALSKACGMFRADIAEAELRDLIRGGSVRRIVDQAGEVMARNGLPRAPDATETARPKEPSREQEQLDDLAAEAKDLAVQCIAHAPTREEADVGREVYAEVADYLGEPVRCVADRDCPGDKLCRVKSGDCLPKGFYCRSPSDCREGSECDVDAEECVERDGFACQRASQCRPGETCFAATRRCVDIRAHEGQPCTVTDNVRYKGLCYSRPGVWTTVGGELECRPSYTPQADDQCDGNDNDCDGSIDEHYRPGEPCDTTDPNVHGECVRGGRECRDGRERCRASTPGVEKCDDGRDNDCNGAVDEGCLVPKPEMCNGADDDLNGVVDDSVECHSVVLYLSDIDDDAYLWKDSPGRREDALCAARFGAGVPGSAECNLSAIARTRPLPESGRFVLKFGNDGCWDSAGVATLVIDGAVVWTKTKSHALRHCNWFYRATLDIDFKRGTFAKGPEDECYNDWDCRD